MEGKEGGKMVLEGNSFGGMALEGRVLVRQKKVLKVFHKGL